VRALRDRLSALGPGLLWAGTAIGVSHLVQATRAGAEHGLLLLWIVILANVFKYPGFEAGPRYAAATGTSLLEGYRRLGGWALALFLIVTVSTMLTVTAGVTIVTAGMASVLFSDAIPVWAWSAGLLATCAAVLAIGRYRLLDRVMKALMLLLTATTLVAVALVLPRMDLGSVALWPLIPDASPTGLIFLCALVGWMPSALDIAVWQSLWGIEKARTEGRPLTVAGARFDFNVGYVGTAVLACAFLLLGAIVLQPLGEDLPDSAPRFAARLIDVYASVLGDSARPLILIAAFTTMLSTTLTVADGFPRALEGAVNRLRGPEVGPEDRSWIYWAALALCGLGALAIIVFFAGSMRALIDVATVLTGLTSGLLGVLNLLVLRRPEVPDEHRPGAAYTAFHVAGIAFMVAMGGLLVYALVARATTG
jgi:Mn2+/Fe2+ NRAMP family transporter